MRKQNIPTRFAGLLALPCALLLTACADDRPQVGIPPANWTEPVAWPVVPAGEAVCDDAETGALVPCLSDRESADLMAGLADALDAANGKLELLSDWFDEYRRARQQER